MTRPAVGGLGAALRIEALKARRSRVPLLVGLGFSLAPLMAGLFMMIMKDPERAAGWGLIRTKAQIVAGTADWPTFLSVLSQAVGVGGMLLFALITAWIFGREFSDRTVENLLATATPRSATVAAKVIVAAGLSLLIAAWVLMLGLAVGALLGLSGGSGDVVLAGSLRLAAVAALTTALLPPVALLASLGRGYLAPLGFALLTLFLAQILAATGWGAWFPWAVPPLLAGLAGPDAARVGAAGYALVAATSMAGLVATFEWWRRADQPR